MASGGYDSVYLSIEEIRSIVIVMFHSLPPIKCLEGGRLVVACYLIGLWMVISHWVFFELFSWLVRIFWAMDKHSLSNESDRKRTPICQSFNLFCPFIENVIFRVVDLRLINK